MKFQINERVIRLKDVYDQTSEVLHGKIVRVYGEISLIRNDYYPELYDVQWDGEKRIDRAFLPHGLTWERR